MASNNSKLKSVSPVIVVGAGTTGLAITKAVHDLIKDSPEQLVRTSFAGFDTNLDQANAAKERNHGHFRHIPLATKFDGIDPRLVAKGLLKEHVQNGGAAGYFSIAHLRFQGVRTQIRQTLRAARDSVTSSARVQEAKRRGLDLQTKTPICVIVGAATGSTFGGSLYPLIQDLRILLGRGAKIAVFFTVGDTDALADKNHHGGMAASVAVLHLMEAIMDGRSCRAFQTADGKAQATVDPDTVMCFANTANDQRRVGSSTADFAPLNDVVASHIVHLCINGSLSDVDAAVVNCWRNGQATGSKPFSKCLSAAGISIIAVPIKQIRSSSTARLVHETLVYLQRGCDPWNAEETKNEADRLLIEQMSQLPSGLVSKLEKQKSALASAVSSAIERALPGSEGESAKKAFKAMNESPELKTLAALARDEAPHYAGQFLQSVIARATTIASKNGPAAGIAFTKAVESAITGFKQAPPMGDDEFGRQVVKVAPNAATTLYGLNKGARAGVLARAKTLMSQRIDKAVRAAFQDGFINHLKGKEQKSELDALTKRFATIGSGLDQWRKEAAEKSAYTALLTQEQAKVFVTEDGGVSVNAECSAVLAPYLNAETFARITARAMSSSGSFSALLEKSCTTELADEHQGLEKRFALREQQLPNLAADVLAARVPQLQLVGDFAHSRPLNSGPDLFVFHPSGFGDGIREQTHELNALLFESPDPCAVTAISVLGPLAITDLEIFENAQQCLLLHDSQGPTIFVHRDGLDALRPIDPPLPSHALDGGNGHHLTRNILEDGRVA